jgi:hypothetical protein
MSLKHQKSLKSYKTVQAKSPIIGENITIRIKAEFVNNRQKGKNMTKLIEAKPLIGYKNNTARIVSGNRKLQNHWLQNGLFYRSSFYKLNRS